MGTDEDAYRRLLDRTRFPGQEYAVRAIQELDYPKEVEDNKIALLRRCNPLLEVGEEHQSLCKEDPGELGPIGTPEKGKEKQGG
jgi:hypothetical protein